MPVFELLKLPAKVLIYGGPPTTQDRSLTCKFRDALMMAVIEDNEYFKINKKSKLIHIFSKKGVIGVRIPNTHMTHESKQGIDMDKVLSDRSMALLKTVSLDTILFN